MKLDKSRRAFLKTMVASVYAGGLSLPVHAAQETAIQGTGTEANKKRPNILWLTIEDTSPQLGCYGNDYAITPHLDRLASEGICFNNAFANSPVCSPARSCLITGVHPTTLGSHFMYSDTRLPEQITCFTEYLRKAGYYCSNNSKEDYNFTAPKTAWDDSSVQAHWRNRKPAQPFFSVFNCTITHQSQSFSDEVASHHIKNLSPEQRHDPAKAVIPLFLTDTPKVRTAWARMSDLITAMDIWVEKILKQLDDDGLADDTIVFFVSDHGMGMPRSKMWLYDTGLQVPLLVRFGKNFRHLAPDGGVGVDNRLVSFVDFAPTVLSLAGVEIPGHMQGYTFLGPKTDEPRKYIYGTRDRIGSYLDICRAVRDQRYKYIRNYLPHKPRFPWNPFHHQMCAMQEIRRLEAEGNLTGAPAKLLEVPRPTEELYDTKTDPYEVNNLAELPEYQNILKRMRNEHVKWMNRTLDMGLLPEHDRNTRCREGESPYEMTRCKGVFPHELIRETALLADQGAEAYTELIKRLKHSDSAVRWWSVVGLTRLGDKRKQTIGALTQALQDSSPEVRITAAETLCQYGFYDNAVATLIESLKICSHPVQLRTLLVLHDIGDKARPALPEIKKLASSQGYKWPLNLFIIWTAADIVKNLNP
jgi:uncharacterized sulfatase